MNLIKNTAEKISLKKAGDLIKKAEKILILTHYRPDGDAIGSSLALSASLKALGKDVYALNRDSTPEYLRFLETPGNQMISGDTSPLPEADLIIALDCATIERLGDTLLSNLPEAPVLTIDHHITNEHYGDHLILDATSAATGEILYHLISENDLPFPPETRDCLYVAISTDTGSLQYSNSTAETYRVMADLVARGVPVAEINAQTYFNHNARRVEILRECLVNYHLACEGQVSYWTVSKEAQERVGVQRGDMEGLMDILRGISGVRACFTIEEGEQALRLSMRSKDENVDVSKVCMHFGGGGHKMAAGAALDMPLEKSAEEVLAVLEKAL